MIKSFKNKDAENIWKQIPVKNIPYQVQLITLRKLFMIHRAKSLKDLTVPPANRLEKLKGDRMGEYSIRINRQYRICFIWKGTDAYEVEIVDYHK
jgi:proteic killer suppression protein